MRSAFSPGCTTPQCLGNVVRVPTGANDAPVGSQLRAPFHRNPAGQPHTHSSVPRATLLRAAAAEDSARTDAYIFGDIVRNSCSVTVRRRGVLGIAALLAASLQPPAAAALPTVGAGSPSPLLQGLWDALGATSPEPVLFPRKPLDLNFAVLLLRSSYDAVDDLDFIPMDKFQIAFWKLRQAEYEPYMLMYEPLKVPAGDLTSPLYFDFISFAQYATISREMPRGLTSFQERCEECDGYETRLVVRPPSVPQDNSQLPAAFQRTVGDKIYSGLRDGFRGVQYGGPQPASSAAGFDDVVAGVSQILSIFVERGYALKAQVRDVVASPSPRGGGSFTVHIEGPANLWGLAALASRRSLAINSFEALAIEGYLRASGREGTYALTRTDTAVDERWTIS